MGAVLSTSYMMGLVQKPQAQVAIRLHPSCDYCHGPHATRAHPRHVWRDARHFLVPPRVREELRGFRFCVMCYCMTEGDGDQCCWCARSYSAHHVCHNCGQPSANTAGHICCPWCGFNRLLLAQEEEKAE